DGHLFLFDKRIVFVFIAMISAVISQIGDLVASSIKRKNNVKDFGKLIPGHGGVMDRFDSVIFVAPFVYYLLVLVTSNIG
ncbi:MAG: phosphatidate cytidylyltransferase, partial [Eubacterium sp.]|nr:phosphatidate cytidylyltransferase [Eubacterium sp.]